MSAAYTVWPHPLEAQAGGGRPCVSEDLPVHHWAEEAVERLQALGLTTYHSNDRVLNRCRVEEALTEAAASVADSRIRQLLSGWQELLHAERTGVRADSAAGQVQLRAAAISVGLQGTHGAAAPGFGESAPDRTGAEALSDGVRGRLSLALAAQLLSHLHLAGSVISTGDNVGLERLELTAPLGPILATVGRGYNRFGDNRGGSIVFSGVAPLDRVEISTRAPLYLPKVLRSVGGISFTTFLATISDDRHADSPFFWGMRGTLEPHPRFRLSVNRASLFGGANQRIRLDNLGMMLLGRVQGKGFEDQVVSLEGSFRLPSEPVIPLTLGLEWGAEDAAGAWVNVPGVVVSLRTPAIPGAEHISAAFEYATFGTSCCGNPEWYRHWSFPGSWALGERPMGHPLGGDGSELLLTSTAHLASATMRLRNDVFVRRRGEENLYVPGREGRSYGLQTEAEWRALPGLDVRGVLSLEAGDGWSDESATLEGKLYFK